MDLEHKCYLIALISFILVAEAILVLEYQQESDIKQISAIINQSAISDSHLLSIDGNIYYVTQYNSIFNLSINDKRR